jgi:tetratricopeptide (TPR) repeat protein
MKMRFITGRGSLWDNQFVASFLAGVISGGKCGLLLLGICAMAPPALAGAIDAEKLARDCRPSVMLILGELKASNQISLGTGFLVSSDGKLVTNHHVIAGASEIVVRSANGKVFPVKAILADDEVHDLAVLQLEAANMPALSLADEAAVQMGSPIVVIGNPEGLEGTITEGIISAIREMKDMGLIYQISAAISHGSSGSPLLNAEGKVLGVATFMKIKGQALNFAVSARTLKDLLANPRYVPKPEVITRSSSPPAAQRATTLEQDAQVSREPAFAELRELENARNFPRMLEAARDLTLKYPQSALAQRRLSDAYYYTAFYKESFGACKRALDLDPANPRGWNNLAMVTGQMNDEKAALEIYRSGLEVAPLDAKLWLDYGSLLCKSNPQAALEALHAGLSLLKGGKGVDAESSNYSLYAGAASDLLFLGATEEAYDTAVVGVREKANDPDSWTALASCAQAKKKYADVKPYLKQALALGGSPDTSYSILASSEEEQGHYAEALDALEWALRTNAVDKSLLTSIVRVSLSLPTLDRAQWIQIAAYVKRLKQLDGNMGQEAEDAMNNEYNRRHGLPP